MSLIKSAADIADLRIAGKKLAAVLRAAEETAKAGVSLRDLDTQIHTHILNEGCRPSFLGYDGFPNSSCLSLNEQVVHGIPDDRILKEGDVLGIDVGLWFNKVCVDAAITTIIGSAPPEVSELLSVTKQALHAGIKAAKPHRRVGMISSAVQAVAETEGYGIVRSLTGHGVGHAIHEDPEIPNYGHPSDGILLRPGMVICIEPMLTAGNGEVMTQVDGWGVVTVDGSLAAHFEHTILITTRGVEILTK